MAHLETAALCRSTVQVARAGASGLAAWAVAGVLCVGSAKAMPEFNQINLVSDIPGLAQSVDPDLVNPWGMSSSATSPIWVSDNGTGLATLYNGAGVKQSLIVTIAPPPASTGPAAPDGQVFNAGAPGSAFNVTAGGKSGSSKFIFATEDGTISGWSPGVNATNSIIAVDNSAGTTSAVYKGLAIGTSGGVTRLYAANFRSGQVEIYDQNFALIGTITDPSVPAGYAPFNVQVLNGQLYVTFAVQDGAKHDDVAGAGNGIVDRFNLDGTGMTRLVSNGGPLDSPWGLALAPSAFGSLAGDLLVGNFGDGTIDAFTASGGFIGALLNTQGTPIAIDGLWGLLPGNGGNGGSPNSLYFTAGPNGESDGLFGFLAVPEPASAMLLLTGLGGIAALRRRAGRRAQPGVG